MLRLQQCHRWLQQEALGGCLLKVNLPKHDYEMVEPEAGARRFFPPRRSPG